MQCNPQDSAYVSVAVPYKSLPAGSFMCQPQKGSPASARSSSSAVWPVARNREQLGASRTEDPQADDVFLEGETKITGLWLGPFLLEALCWGEPPEALETWFLWRGAYFLMKAKVGGTRPLILMNCLEGFPQQCLMRP